MAERFFIFGSPVLAKFTICQFRRRGCSSRCLRKLAIDFFSPWLLKLIFDIEIMNLFVFKLNLLCFFNLFRHAEVMMKIISTVQDGGGEIGVHM